MKKSFKLVCICLLVPCIIYGWREFYKNIVSEWLFVKPHTIKSAYSKNQKEFLQVYCEDEFNFQKAGTLTGSFMFSSKTDFDALRLQILIPKLYMRTPEGKQNR